MTQPAFAAETECQSECLPQARRAAIGRYLVRGEFSSKPAALRCCLLRSIDGTDRPTDDTIRDAILTCARKPT